jgi:hypothetical protein
MNSAASLKPVIATLMRLTMAQPQSFRSGNLRRGGLDPIPEDE